MSRLDVKLASLDLLNLGKVVQFYPEDLDGDDGETRPYKDINLRTRTTDARGKLTSSFSGHPSIILYSQQAHESLCSAYQQVQRDGGLYDPDLLTKYFGLAKMLLHEIAHAADMACHGYRPQDTPFEYSVVSEAGFDCETAIFGGVADWNPLERSEFIEEWPAPAMRAWYIANDSTMYCGGELDEPVTRRWRVPEAWIQQLFLKAFWVQVVPVVGADALKAPRLLGSRFVMRECKCDFCKTASERERCTERPDVPGCCAGEDAMLVPTAKGERDMIGVPDGYYLWDDGTLVKAELRKLVKRLEKKLERAKSG
ncbi:hypothetical protein LTR36_001428 [Oleoguttula mirabilis]|uniref:Uncharacterized protein n=1 Tax=Oleoguttula mirabilis TaxID=1507867 RepID=A0AAV9JQG6_9PEZI|nr:hypothetical protein LTR36_001428 [Oleoguttula mirabilis]